MSIGQEGDTRQFKRLKRSDYYELKKGDEVKPIDKWPKCKTCGQEITNSNWNGYCLRCSK